MMAGAVPARLVALYSLLAAAASLCNLLVQFLFLLVYSGKAAVLVSVIFGTGVGLVVKYVLDKRYIFHFQAQNTQQDARTFVLYAWMGLLTTVLFWTLEFGFHWGFDGSAFMRYFGGALGLAIGYVVKYQLDKRYVFKHKVTL